MQPFEDVHFTSVTSSWASPANRTANCLAQHCKEGSTYKAKTKRKKKPREKKTILVKPANIKKSALIQLALAYQCNLKQDDAFDHIYSIY